jgi:hypothetical protein
MEDGHAAETLLCRRSRLRRGASPYCDKVQTAVSWFTQVFLRPGPEGDALRARVLPQLESDLSFFPDTLIAGRIWRHRPTSTAPGYSGENWQGDLDRWLPAREVGTTITRAS